MNRWEQLPRWLRFVLIVAGFIALVMLLLAIQGMFGRTVANSAFGGFLAAMLCCVLRIFWEMAGTP